MMVEGSAFTRNDVFQMAIRVAFVSAVTYFSIKWLVNQIDPTSKSRKKAEERAREQLRKAGLGGKHSVALDKLTDHEMIIASQLVVPDEINVNWKDIAGLDHLIQELRETVILPIQKRELFADSRLTQPPKGVLLHGPPGCGKTLIAKATAKEANMSFINLDVSLLTDKWYGETQKLAAAVFSLAVKLQPCIVFIDEIESFLRTRTAHDHEATAMMKTQFMSLWDGLITDPGCTVIIMGATNRPQDLDKAIQRRMPATFHVPMPNESQRERILQLILRSEPVATDIEYGRLAANTEGFSGSDLHELCRHAAVFRVRDLARDELARERSRTEAQVTLALLGHGAGAARRVSSSDLHELCRHAAVFRVRDLARDELARERSRTEAQVTLALLGHGAGAARRVSSSDLHELCRHAAVFRVRDLARDELARERSRTEAQVTLALLGHGAGAARRVSSSDLHELCRHAAVFRVRDLARDELARERSRTEAQVTLALLGHGAGAARRVSSSDLHELCRHAAVFRVRDLARDELARERSRTEAQNNGNDTNNSESDDEYMDAVRPITMEDLRLSLAKLKESKIQCGSLAPSMRIELD
ncbi:outer mitochondrial transmembrane helix translocase isoform X2 [Epargyreus clarus]|uniref:outer mitochondrial transmembrane helix translocase isoform X2 n=1 Tax=Epargyreus clarus TaxID=520877 RepID=UPI003C2CD8FA